MTKSFPRSPATQPPSGVVGDTLSGASANAETGSREPDPQAVPALSGFDPARGGLFRKRPVEIEAFQWCNQDRNDWPEWAAEDTRLEDICAVLIGTAAVGLKVWTEEGPIRASHGDWIIRGVAGEVYPCKPEIFAATHEFIGEKGK